MEVLHEFITGSEIVTLEKPVCWEEASWVPEALLMKLAD